MAVPEGLEASGFSSVTALKDFSSLLAVQNQWKSP